MSTKRDYYDVLGVSKAASLSDIKKAYREAVLRSHPDRVAPEKKKAAEEQFKEISEAYAVLSDPNKRAFYDQYGRSGIEQQYAYEDIFSGTDFGSAFEGMGDYGVNENLFDQIFGNFGFDIFGRQRAQRRPAIRYDLEISAELSLEEAFSGVEKRIRQAHIAKSVFVTIPKGVDTGTRLRVKGEGGGMGNERGDLYVILTVRPHPGFGRKNSDLTMVKEIPLTVALLGGEIKIPLLSGKTATMKIPAGTENGTIFSLRGKGMPHLNRSGAGNLLVTIKVNIPQNLTEEQKRLVKDLAKTLI